MAENCTKIRPALMGMAVGETLSFPIDKLKSVRTQASELGAMFERRFTTKTDRSTRLITITRTS